MGFIIPSKNIFKKQNPKVIDNVIDRIEINAYNIEPYNTYDSTVYNNSLKDMENGLPENQKNYENFKLNYKTQAIPNPESNEDPQYRATLLVGYYNISSITKTFNFSLPKNIDLTSKIIKVNPLSEETKNSSGELTEIPKINFSTIAEVFEGTGKIDIEISDKIYNLNENNIKIIKRYDRIFSNEPLSSLRVFVPDLSFEVSKKTAGGEYYPVVTQESFNLSYGGDLPAQKNGTISAKIIENENTYDVTTEVLCGAYFDDYKYSNMAAGYDNDSPFETDITLSGKSIWYKPISVEFTLYGNTIGIDLKDETVYINGNSAKKVYSVGENELLQKSNTINLKENALEELFSKTQKQYANGKETATVECSISDYDENEEGKPSIRVDNSTGKMLFEIGDKVIPMVYVGNGEDRPMSKYKNGQHKVFEVLGVKIKYNGVPRQILDLQEVTLDTE